MDLIKKKIKAEMRNQRDIKELNRLINFYEIFFELLPQILLPKSKDIPLEKLCFNDHISR